MKLETKNFELETGSKKKRWLQNILVAAVIVIVAVAVATRGQSGFFRFLLGERVPFPGLQKDGSYVLSNFEHDQDIRLWKLVDAKMMPHMDRSSNGLRSAKVTFRGLSDYSGIVLEDLIKTHKGISDWTSFESLDLDLFNEAKDPQTVMLVVSDLWGKHYQRPVTLPPDRWQAVSIPVKTIAASLNIQQVNQISFSMNRLRQDQAIDVDEIRLTPTPDARAALAKQAKTKHAVNMLDYGFAKLKPAWSGEDRATKTPIVRVPFVVKNETPGLRGKAKCRAGCRSRRENSVPSGTCVCATTRKRTFRSSRVCSAGGRTGPSNGRRFIFSRRFSRGKTSDFFLITGRRSRPSITGPASRSRRTLKRSRSIPDS